MKNMSLLTFMKTFQPLQLCDLREIRQQIMSISFYFTFKTDLYIGLSFMNR